MQVFITQHCKSRYLERIKNHQNTSDNLLIEILNSINTAKDITNQIYDKIPRFILFLYEKYKTANMKIMKNDHILYVMQKRVGTDHLFDVVTCYYDNGNYLEQYKNTVLSREEIFMKIKLIKKQLK